MPNSLLFSVGHWAIVQCDTTPVSTTFPSTTTTVVGCTVQSVPVTLDSAAAPFLSISLGMLVAILVVLAVKR